MNNVKEDIMGSAASLPTSILYCQFCKTNVDKNKTIKSEHELLCGTCGFVLQEEHQYLDLTETATGKKMSNSTTTNWKDDLAPYASYDLGLSTTMDASCKDHSGRSYLTKSNLNLKKTSLRAKSTTSIERNSFKGYMEAIRLGKALYIPNTIVKEVIDTYNKYSKQELLKNRNVNSCIVCLLVIYCNAYNIPLPISEALKETTVSRKKFNKDYFNLYYLFENASPTGAKVSAYLEKLLSHINNSWPDFDLFKTRLQELEELGLFENLEGRDVIVTTGTVTYMLLKFMGYPLLDIYAKKLILNRLTIKNKWAILTSKWPILLKYQAQN